MTHFFKISIVYNYEVEDKQKYYCITELNTVLDSGLFSVRNSLRNLKSLRFEFQLNLELSVISNILPVHSIQDPIRVPCLLHSNTSQTIILNQI
jgi:hypothetical protein